MPKRKTRLHNLTLRQYTIPVRRKSRRSTRTRRGVVSKPSLSPPRAKRPANTTNPLAECKVEGCHEVTTVGPLCQAHWEEKALRRQSQTQARPAPTGSTPTPGPGPARRRWLVIPAPSPLTGYTRPIWLYLPL